MTTKNLSRTVIEGGRHRYNVWERRSSHRAERADQREYLRAVEHDPAVADARAPRPRKPVGKGFHDRLAAAERWLLGHVGRPWRKVEGEILATFDTRTVAGRHVVHAHLMPRSHRIWGDPELRSWRVSRRVFFIDARGVLRVRSAQRRARRRFENVRDEVVRTLGRRRVAYRNARLFWLEPTGRLEDDGTLAYRRSHELDGEEHAWWRSLTRHERAYAQDTRAPRVNAREDPRTARRTLQRDLKRLVEAGLVAEIGGPTDSTRHDRWLGGEL